VVGQTTPDRLKDALSALDIELGRIAEPGYIDPEQVAASKAERAVSTAFGIERATAFSHTLGFWWAVASLEYYMGYIDSMAAQTVADLQGYARKYIVGKNRITGVIIDPESRRRLNLSEASLLSRVVQ
jgi:zinc protease